MNILFLLADQWIHDAFSYRGHPHARTPNIDRLVSGAAAFTNAFTTCPLCSPARGTLMTGLWPHENGMRDNLGAGWSRQAPLDDGLTTWLDIAKSNGYRTGYFGKWHLGANGPAERGAEFPPGGIESGRRKRPPTGPYDDFGQPFDPKPFAMDAGRFTEGSKPPFYACRETGIEDCMDWRVAEGALGFLDRDDGERPWFLTASFPGPHFPHSLPAEIFELFNPADFELPANFDDGFESKPWYHSRPWWPCQDTSQLSEDDWKRTMAAYYGMVYLVDAQIGRIIEKAEVVSADRPLTIVFAADHGEMLGAHSLFDKGAHFYEEEIRQPFAIRLPEDGPVPALAGDPRLRREFVGFMDLSATLFRLAGGEGPNGRDLAALARDESPKDAFPDEAYSVYHYYNGHAFACRMIRTERYKYVFNPQSVDELYDLEEDPGELRNLADDPIHGETLAVLRKRLFAWLERVDDPIRHNWNQLPPAGKRQSY